MTFTQEPFQQLNPSDQVVVLIFVKPAKFLASQDDFWGYPKNDGMHDASQYLERRQMIPK